MPKVPSGLTHQATLDREVEKAVQKLPKSEVVRVRHSLGFDSTGEPAIFFHIVLNDSAASEDRLADVTGRIATTLSNELHPHDQGFIPYFSFRSKSEQDQRKNDPEWA